MGIRQLRRIEIGRETTKGTLVNTTIPWLGQLTFERKLGQHRPVEDLGRFAEHNRSIKVSDLVNLHYSGAVTLEQIIYLGLMGIKSIDTPDDEGSPPYGWDFTPAHNAAGSYDSFTVQFGDDVEQLECGHVMASQIVISGAMDDVVKVEADLFGKSIAVCDFSGPHTIPSVTHVPTQLATVYIDNAGGIGNTAKSQTLVAFRLTIKTGLYPKRYGDGGYDFTTYGEGPKAAELELTMAYNSNAEAERVLYDGSTKREVRLYFPTSAGYGLYLDIGGVYTAFSTLEERPEGEDVVRAVIGGETDTTNLPHMFRMISKNSVASVADGGAR